MKSTNYIVNKQGLNEIRDFLSVNHIKGGDHFTNEMLSAWAADAEYQASEGNPPTIEIKASESVNGYTQEYQISSAGGDVKSVEIDE